VGGGRWAKSGRVVVVVVEPSLAIHLHGVSSEPGRKLRGDNLSA
jgi:hypothetical protein